MPSDLPLPEAILAALDDAVLVTDEAGAILWTSERVAELWGYATRELRNKKLPFLLSFEAKDATKEKKKTDSSERRAPGAARQLEAYGKNGVTFPVAVRSVPLDQDGRKVHVVLVRDLTAFADARTRLRELDTALGRMQVGVAIADRDLRVRYANPALAAIHGYTLAELIGQPLTQLMPEGQAPLEFREVSALKTVRQEANDRRADGSLVPVEILHDLVVTDEGDAVGLVTICQDITERKRTQEALRESEERYALAVRGANDGIWDWNLSSGEIYFSIRWKEMLGFEPEEIAGAPDEWFSRVHPEDLKELRARIDEHLERRSEHFEHESRMLHRDGAYRWMLARGIAVWDESGRATRIAGSQTDITDRKVHDPLTGLPNRTLFLDRIERVQSRALRERRPPFAVVLLDLDGFKMVNDSLGHPAGDELLTSVARRLEGSLRAGDTVARLSGDEFAILVEEVDGSGEAEDVARRILDTFARPFPIGEHELFATASLGIVLGPDPARDLAGFLRDAATAMHRAKAGGRGEFRLYTHEMQREALERLRIESDLRRAMERQEFVVYYQPIVELDSLRIRGYEALVRWQHRERGLLYPLEFIRVAEETGLILPIGTWVLREACFQLARWQREYAAAKDLTMSVNFSARSFAQPNLADMVRQIVNESGIHGTGLKIEITEGSLVENPTTAIATIEQLRAVGVGVAIDDFGTGYSSLSYLHRFPVDVLKIDRSFIQILGREGEKTELVRGILRLARDLNLTVVAEGVETEEQRARLLEMGGEFMQGYLFARPVEPGEAWKLFLDQTTTA